MYCKNKINRYKMYVKKEKQEIIKIKTIQIIK